MGNDEVVCELGAILYTPIRGETKKSPHKEHRDHGGGREAGLCQKIRSLKKRLIRKPRSLFIKEATDYRAGTGMRAWGIVI